MIPFYDMCICVVLLNTKRNVFKLNTGGVMATAMKISFLEEK